MPIPRQIFDRKVWLAFFTYALFVFSTLSVTGIELSVIALYLLATYHRLQGSPYELLPYWVYAPFVGWIAVGILSALVNTDPMSNLVLLRHQYRIILPFVLLLGFSSIKLENLLIVYLICFCVIAVYGVIQVFFALDLLRAQADKPFFPFFISKSGLAFYRARGFYAGPGSFANHMMMITLLFLSLGFTGYNKLKYAWLLGAFITSIGLLASFGRSAWIGAIIGGLVLVMRLPRRWSVPINLVSISLLVFAAAVNENGSRFPNFGDGAPSAILHRLMTANTANNESQIRIQFWQAGYKALQDNPWLGVGLENRKAILPYLGEMSPSIRAIAPITKRGADLHNIYLQVALYLGLIGLSIYVAMWIAIFFWNAQWIRRAGSAFPLESGVLWGTTAALVGSVFDGMFHDTFFSANANTTILMFMGLSLYAGLRIRRVLQTGTGGE